MYKLSLTILLALGMMAFNQPNKDKSGNSDKNSKSKNTSLTKGKHSSKNNDVFDQKQQGKKSDNGKKSNSKNNKNFDGKNKGINTSKNEGKQIMKHYEKGHPNFNYVFVNDHGYYSHKNYGQWRSEQARNKHKNYRPKYEYEAIEGFRLINVRNVFLVSETDFKINLLRTRLAQKRKANQITVVQYDTYVNRIEVLEE
ncbi:MAG: hypothetical protein WD512_20580, partial [Candidatus Paceibacterota bacterium]